MSKEFKREFFKDIWIMIVSLTFMFFYTVIYRMFDIADRTLAEVRLTSYSAIFLPVFILVIMIAIYLFSYKNNREKLDLIHSLPISRRKYFLIQYIKGLIYFSITYFICIATAAILDLIFYPQYTVLTIYFLLYILKYWLLTTLLYTIFVFASTVCAMNIYSIFFGMYVIVFPFITTELISTYSYKNNPYFSNNFGDFGSLYDRFMMMDFSSNYYSIPTYLFTIVILILLNCLILFTALKLYEHFKSENTATPVGFDRLKSPILIATVFSITTFVVLILLQTQTPNLLFIFIITLVILPIISLIIEFLINEGFKNIKPKKALRNIIVSFTIVFTYYVFINTNIHFNSVTDIDSEDVLYCKFYTNDITRICIEDDISDAIQFQKTLVTNLPKSFYDRQRNVNEQTSTTDTNPKMHTFYFGYNLTNDRYISFNYDVTEEEYNQLIPLLNPDFGTVEQYRETLLPSTIDYFDVATLRSEIGYNIFEVEYYFNSYQYYYPFKSDRSFNGQSLKSALIDDIENIDENNSDLFTGIPLATLRFRTKPYWSTSLDLDITSSYINTMEVLESNPYHFGEEYYVYEISDAYINNALKNIKPLTYRQNAYFDFEGDSSHISLNNNIMSFESKDVIDDKVSVQVYTGEITSDAIKEYNLKIIIPADNNSNFYFGTVE